MKKLKLLRLNYREIIFVFLAFGVMAGVAYFSVGYILRNRLLNQAIEMISTAEANVNSGLLGAESILLNSSHNVQSLLEQNVSMQEIHDYLITTTEWIQQRNERNNVGLFDYFGIFGYINGEFIDGIGLDIDDSYISQTRPWYQTAIRSGDRIGYTAPYRDYSGETVVSAVRNIVINDSLAGILVVHINIERLMDYVSSLTVAPGGYGILISQNMTLVSYPDSTFLGSQLRELGAAYSEIAQALRSGNDVLGQRINEPGGRPTIVFFTDIFNGWYLGIITPYHMFYRDLYITGLIIIALGLVLSLLLCYILLRLSAARIRADEESRYKTSFLADMSHEIRTPMNAITGMAELLLRNELPPELRSYVQDIKHAGNNLVSIINDILDISKIEAGKLEIIPVNYMLSSMINDTVNIIRMRLNEKPIHLYTDIDETIPNNLIGDEIRLRQILLNLLSNAAKYTEKGKINFSVTADERTEKQIKLKITVADTGFGMKPEDVESLFSDFVQVDIKKNRGIEGTGLGLAITKRLCTAMGGSISVESEYGLGSTFTVTIPQDISSPEPIASMDFSGINYAENTLVNENTFPDARILIVDDLSVNLKVAEGLLAPYKVKTDTCESGREAIELVKKNNYDIIFMDHMMSGMDGMETTACIRKFNTEVPIIALTANAVVGMKEKFLENGFNDLLTKPIDVLKLDEILNRWLGSKGKGLQEKANKTNKAREPLGGRQCDDNSTLPVPRPRSPVPYKTKKIKPLNTINKFIIFSCILFIFISAVSFTAYTISARQINLSHIEQQLAIASETIRLHLATTVNSELTLVLKLADTDTIKQYFLNPADSALKTSAHAELAHYEQHFKTKQAFWVNDADKIFYSTGNDPYLVDPDDADSYWYNMTLYDTEIYNFNINYNHQMQQINLWVNVPVFIYTEDGIKKPIGMLGTGIDLTEFSEFIASGYRGFDQKITPFMFNKFNEITSSLDYDLIFNKIRIDDHLGEAGRELIRAAQILEDEGSTSFIYDGNIYLIRSIPAMEWYLAVSHPLPGLLALNNAMNILFFSMLLLIFLIFLVLNIFIYRSEKAIAEQNRQLIETRKIQASLQAKTEFLGKISHEIRTPINAITGMNELVLRSDIPEEVRGYAQDIKQAGAALISIVNDLLSFSENDLQKNEEGKTGEIQTEAAAGKNEKGSLSIPGIDVEKGIASTGGIDNYLKVLQFFCKDANERLALFQKIQQHNNEEDLKDFITQVHAIKSASASIGALNISRQAAALEQAGQAENIDFIREKLPVFTEDLSELVKNIMSALVSEADKIQNSETNTESLNTGSGSLLLRTLPEALEKQDVIEIDRILEKLSRQSFDSKTKELLDEINSYVLTGDYEKAKDITDKYFNK